jgi:altronate dehydratase
LGRAQGLSRFVTLVHTEGCGVSGGRAEELYRRTLLGYLTHPLVKHALLLEHGCEKTHNDYMRHHLAALGLDPQQFGWASIQLDGGIERVMAKIEAWFSREIERAAVPTYGRVGLAHLRLGLLNAGPLSAEAGHSLTRLTQFIVASGGTVVVPEQTGLLTAPGYRDILTTTSPSLAYGQRVEQAGFHIMETPSTHWVETLTGLAASGVELILAHLGDQPRQSHPLVPVVQVTAEADLQHRYQADLDLALTGLAQSWPTQMLRLLVDVIEQRHLPRLHQQGNIDFQITRGLLGVSL